MNATAEQVQRAQETMQAELRMKISEASYWVDLVEQTLKIHVGFYSLLGACYFFGLPLLAFIGRLLLSLWTGLIAMLCCCFHR